MEILTLLKANIRRKKGSFLSVILLTLIIAMSVTIILSISKEETENKHCLGKYVQIYKADSCGLTSGQFCRQLNLDTGVTDIAVGTTTNDMSLNFTTLFPETISSILLVFIILLLIIVIIVTVHNISVEIETNYVTFGVLKAQGFDKTRFVFYFWDSIF